MLDSAAMAFRTAATKWRAVALQVHVERLFV
jgi:hypothetical protein